MKKQLVVLTIIFTLLLTGCSDDKREQETVSGLFSVPYSYSLDKQSLEFSQNDLIIPFFSYDRDCLSEKYPIEQTYIRSKDGAKILETTIAFEHEPAEIYMAAPCDWISSFCRFKYPMPNWSSNIKIKLRIPWKSEVWRWPILFPIQFRSRTIALLMFFCMR